METKRMRATGVATTRMFIRRRANVVRRYFKAHVETELAAK